MAPIWRSLLPPLGSWSSNAPVPVPVSLRHRRAHTLRRFITLRVSRFAAAEACRIEVHVENTSNVLTIKEVAKILRCSKGHVQNVLVGKVCAYAGPVANGPPQGRT